MKIDPAAILNLLREVGAPPPRNITRIAKIVDLLDAIPSLIDDREWLAERLRTRYLHDRAQAAIDERRRTVPQIIEHERKIGKFFDDDRYSYNSKSLENWLDTLPDFLAMPSSPAREEFDDEMLYSPTKIWQGHAVLLFIEYAAVTGKSSISKDGPAARFIKGCFDLIGVHSQRGLEAIAKAVRKSIKKSAPKIS